MKKLLLYSFALLLCGSVNAQQTISDSILHEGIYRSYILYVPASYSAGTEVPLVMNFHGYTSNAVAQMYYGDFRPIADTANFLLVCPQGTLDGSNQPYWNAGMGGAVDDIGFAEALIDSLSAQYINKQSRVYSTGMSNGGYMSFSLACELSNRIAAIASVTGSITQYQNLICVPQHPMPVMQIHGTADNVVLYNGSPGSLSIPELISNWVNMNMCDLTPVQTEVPNTNLSDGCTATHFRYLNGNNGVEVEHFRINSGGHTWPGAPIVVGTTNYDINASKEIWRFFSKYDINGAIVGIGEISEQALSIHPNPAKDKLKIEFSSPQQIQTITVLNTSGQVVTELTEAVETVDVSALSPGVYFLKVDAENGSFVQKFIRE